VPITWSWYRPGEGVNEPSPSAQGLKILKGSKASRIILENNIPENGLDTSSYIHII
jgi:hypothetical protein